MNLIGKIIHQDYSSILIDVDDPRKSGNPLGFIKKKHFNMVAAYLPVLIFNDPAVSVYVILVTHC